MKTGKFINLGAYRNVKIGYGTIDYKNLKTIYLQLNSWLEPIAEEDVNFDKLVTLTRRKIKEKIYGFKCPLFKNQSIVDLDVKTNTFRPNKRSFMDLEITLYVDKPFDLRSTDIRDMIRYFLIDIIDEGLDDKNLFNFHLNKK